MRIGTVLIKSGEEVTVFIDDLGIRVKCRLLKHITVEVNDTVLIEFLPGGKKGVIIGVM
ncbi:MAG: hypothetical protein MR945_09120 [Agathobacter sp.]|nr:hypothetical protein [Agathobacter sp.]